MTNEVTEAAKVQDGGPANQLATEPAPRDPMQKAIEGGYKEEPVPSREERAAAVVAELEHASNHNAPVTLAMLKEIRDLLDVPTPDDTPIAQVSEAQV